MLVTLVLHIGLLTEIQALTPFWNSQSGFWASSGTTATSNLYYSYPEFNGLDLGNADAVQVAIGNYIQQQYGGGQFSLKSAVPGVNLLAQPPAAAPAPAKAPAPAAPQGHVQAALAAVSSSVKSAAADVAHRVHSHGSPTQAPTVVHDWAVRIHAKKYELGHSYMVLIFLGEVPADPSQWRSAPSFIGIHVTFVNTEAEQCANCREQAEVVAEGFVHLNGAIAKRSNLSSFEPSVVAPYLRDNLHWRVQSVRVPFCFIISF
jgi:tyrosinase